MPILEVSDFDIFLAWRHNTDIMKKIYLKLLTPKLVKRISLGCKWHPKLDVHPLASFRYLSTGIRPMDFDFVGMEASYRHHEEI